MHKELSEFGEHQPELISVSENGTKMVIDPRLMSQGSIRQILINQIYNYCEVGVRIVYTFDGREDEITPEQIVEAGTIWPRHESQYFIEQKAQELSYADTIIIEHFKRRD